MKWTRRHFLKTLGIGLGTLPFMAMLERSVFGAKILDRPTRFIGLYHPHGASSPLYLKPGETAFDISYNNCVLAPFDDAATYGRSFKDSISVLEGLDILGATGHNAPQALLTGSAASNSSLDQYMAVERGLGADTPVTSAILSVGNAVADTDNSISYGRGGTPLPKIYDPQQTFDSLFGNFTTSDDPAEKARQEAARRRGKSIIDFIRKDVTRLEGRLATTEKLKLDQHLTSIREIEKRLESTNLPSDGPMCSVPGKPRRFNTLLAYNGGEINFDEITDLQIDILAQAMACDITRFGTLWLNDLSQEGAQGAGISGLPLNNHDDLAHLYDAPVDSHYNDGGAPGNPASWQRLGILNRYHYGKGARMLQNLDMWGALDETLFWMSTDMGDPSLHNSRNTPTLIGGGAGAKAKFNLGRRITLARDCPKERIYCADPTLIPNNHLLVTIAQAFGLSDVDRYGGLSDPALNQGEIGALMK